MTITQASLLALSAGSLALSWRRPGLRPIAAACVALLWLTLLRALPLRPRVDLALWLAWPGVSAALSWRVWRVWRGSWAAAVAFGWLAFALAGAPWSWAKHEAWYAVAVKAPHVVASLVSLVAWAGKPAGMASGDARAARRVASVLAWSGFVDVVLGALAPGASWERAAPLSWATWAAVAVVLCTRFVKRS